MILNFLMRSLRLLLKAAFTMASFKDTAFRKELEEKDFLLQVKLVKRNQSGYLQLRKGSINAGGKAGSQPPDLLVEWQDGLTALRALKKLTPKDLVASIHREISSGRLSIECNLASSVWFLNRMRKMLIILSS